ncbi:MarR family winged helix-turn-helix transcriptional regulator [Mesorhizobium sp. ANAO-SY3R2]|uniref:MarR family winged helix-turn-helix transcriptional regulator n=1 Tax=Mesorhizobium sp. ANAO-SY3R2 TaxID=3166644 RepID=UPI00366E0273
MSKETSDRQLIGQLLLSVARLWRAAADRALDDCGLSHASAMPLLALSRLGDNARQGVIAEHLGLEGPSLVRIVDLLLAEQLVTRREDPLDRRAKILTLTELGRARVCEIERVMQQLREHLLADADADELEKTIALLERMESKLLEDEQSQGD